MITRIEKAMIAKLQKGLGHLVREVTSYGSELSALEMGEVIRVLPAVWVNFGGITSTQALITSRKEYKTTALFTVIVATRNLRSEQTQRYGGAHKDEVGANQLVYAVRRLLTNQDLTDIDEGLAIDFLYPKRVRPLTSRDLEKAAISVYACEFQTFWYEEALENNRFPEPVVDDEGNPVNPDDSDNIFIDYEGETSEPYPDLEGVHVDLYQDLDKDPDMSLEVNLKGQENDED